MSLIDEVKQLKEKPSGQVREAIAGKVARYYNSGVFDDKEKILANEILRLLARDAEVRVRKAMSVALKSNPSIPHDVAVSFANDNIEVAEEFLKFSPVLNDSDLIAIIQGTEELARLKAISDRPAVSTSVSGELIKKRQEAVIVSLFENKKAAIPDMYFEMVIDEFKDNNNIIESLVHRGGLSISIAEKVISFVSEEWKEKLKNEYNIEEKVAESVVSGARESATIGLLNVSDEKNKVDSSVKAEGGTKKLEISKQVRDLVDHLHDSDKLTYSMVIRALCEGHVDLFETCIAKIAGIPLVNAHTLIWDENPKAFHSLYSKAKMPESVFEAFSLIVQIVKQEVVKENFDQKNFKNKLIQIIEEKGYEETVPLMPYVKVLIGSKVNTANIMGIS